jgi:cyclophilin family peptidyl-prolyl cis-trans isomerase
VIGRQDFLQLLQLLPLLEVPTTLPAPNAAPAFPDAKITDKIFMDIRVSRQDGSFYVRDDLADTFENRVLSTRLEFGLYGNLAPNHVQKFLSYVISSQNEDVNNPLPSYSRSTFVALDQSTGLLQGGNIPSLRVSDIGGSNAIQYGSRVLPANLWLDSNTKVSHSCKGLLTHRTLDVTPAFGITTRAASSSLDATNTVFGQILWNDKTAQFWNQLQDLPTYSLERPAASEDPTGTGVGNSVFNAQREFFRGAAQNLGDTRVAKVYEGKLLRRMEVTQVGRL